MTCVVQQVDRMPQVAVAETIRMSPLDLPLFTLVVVVVVAQAAAATAVTATAVLAVVVVP